MRIVRLSQFLLAEVKHEMSDYNSEAVASDAFIFCWANKGQVCLFDSCLATCFSDVKLSTEAVS